MPQTKMSLNIEDVFGRDFAKIGGIGERPPARDACLDHFLELYQFFIHCRSPDEWARLNVILHVWTPHILEHFPEYLSHFMHMQERLALRGYVYTFPDGVDPRSKELPDLDPHDIRSCVGFCVGVGLSRRDIIIARLGKLGMREAARMLMESEHRHVEGYIRYSILRLLNDICAPERAIEFAEEGSHIPLDVMCAAQVAHAYALVGDMERCGAIIEMAMALEGPQPRFGELEYMAALHMGASPSPAMEYQHVDAIERYGMESLSPSHLKFCGVFVHKSNYEVYRVSPFDDHVCLTSLRCNLSGGLAARFASRHMEELVLEMDDENPICAELPVATRASLWAVLRSPSMHHSIFYYFVHVCLSTRKNRPKNMKLMVMFLKKHIGVVTSEQKVQLSVWLARAYPQAAYDLVYPLRSSGVKNAIRATAFAIGQLHGVEARIRFALERQEHPEALKVLSMLAKTPANKEMILAEAHDDRLRVVVDFEHMSDEARSGAMTSGEGVWWIPPQAFVWAIRNKITLRPDDKHDSVFRKIMCTFIDGDEEMLELMRKHGEKDSVMCYYAMVCMILAGEQDDRTSMLLCRAFMERADRTPSLESPPHDAVIIESLVSKDPGACDVCMEEHSVRVTPSECTIKLCAACVARMWHHHRGDAKCPGCRAPIFEGIR